MENRSNKQRKKEFSWNRKKFINKRTKKKWQGNNNMCYRKKRNIKFYWRIHKRDIKKYGI